MSKIVFELTVEARDAGSDSDPDEIENICNCVLDGMGFPQAVKVTAKVISREPDPK